VTTEESRRAAIGLIRCGVAPIPVPAGEKNPGRLGWETLRISEEEVPSYWTNGQNVGVLCGEPSGWLVDVDLDADEAVKVAGRFMPPTRTSGREKRLASHWWYVSVGATSTDWADFGDDGRVDKLVEVRSSGRHTLVSPSTGPEGDPYLWHDDDGVKATEIVPEELLARCRELATAALIARHVPPTGGRHDFALALAGFVLRPGRMGEGLALKILQAAWHAAGADSREAVRDLEGIVRDTAARIEADEPTVGGPTLEESGPGIVLRLSRWWGWGREEQGQDAPEEKEERRNQADRLIGYALEELGASPEALIVDQHGAPHALVGGEPVPLNSRCYSWLRRLMWEQEGKAVNGEYLKTAVGTLAAHAEFSGEVRELHTRAAWHEGNLYYELRPGRVVRCGASGWGFAENPPVLFRRYPNLKPLPNPEPGGSLDVLDSLVNLKTERDRRLFKAYLATVPFPHVGRPILNAAGAMGSGKTTIGRVVKRTWDPTAPETVRYDPRDFLQKASHASVLVLDNLSTLPEPAADSFCRLVTGEADSKRKLYTDDEDVIVELRRAVLLNGINIPTDRSDVLDRSLVVELERIPDAKRRTEEELWERFESERPKLLGALFGVLSEAIALKASLQLSRRPRLADWGEYAAAVYEVMGWGAETFLEDWDEVVKVQNRATLDGSPVAQAVIRFMEARGSYQGTSTELHKALETVAEDIGVSVTRDKAWPKSARWTWRRIQEVVPLLVAVGIEVSRSENKRGTIIALRKTPADDATDATTDETPPDKTDAGGNIVPPDATVNATGAPDATANATRNPADSAENGNSGNSGNSSGDFSQATRALLAKPPGWLRNQIKHARAQGFPETQLKALAAAVARVACRDGTRGEEVLPAVKAFLTHGVGCGCEECA
jgi:hypothetical protein